MLSYQHAYHAGNFADVLKHVVLTQVLQYLCEKDKPIRYIDTHAGAGLYPLAQAEMQRLKEYSSGVQKIWPGQLPPARASAQAAGPHHLPGPIQTYLTALRRWNTTSALATYPGSPALAYAHLRSQDQLHLAELHPKTFRQLNNYVARAFEPKQANQTNQNTNGQPPRSGHNDPRCLTFQTDGFKHLQASLPPPKGRACVLIDPAYEVKADYDTVIDALKTGHARFSSGVFLLWYPIVKREWVEKLKNNVTKTGIKNTSYVELGIAQDTGKHGMTASGLILINAPWNLKAQLQESLEFLCQRLSDSGYWRHELLVDEQGARVNKR